MLLFITDFVGFLDAELMLSYTIEQAHVFGEIQMLKNKLCISFGRDETGIEDIQLTNSVRLKKEMNFLIYFL